METPDDDCSPCATAARGVTQSTDRFAYFGKNPFPLKGGELGRWPGRRDDQSGCGNYPKRPIINRAPGRRRGNGNSRAVDHVQERYTRS